MEYSESPSQSSGAWARAIAPASLSNLGPGFDALGLCIDTHQDVVEARLDETLDGVIIDEIVGLYDRIPLNVEQNTSSIAASVLLNHVRNLGGTSTHGIRLRINKGIPLGSGIGGSAASAVAGAVAAASALGIDTDNPMVMDAALEGEAFASGSRHGDNVLPSLLGGLVVTTPKHPERYQRVSVTGLLSMALVLPSISILTEAARNGLPDMVPFENTIRNAAGAAGIVAACLSGDWKSLGTCIMVDDVVEPVRAALVPGFDAACMSAMESGAHGVALSGSGPAMFAVCAHDAHARRVADAMTQAFSLVGVDAASYVAHPSNEGCTVEMP